MKLKDNPVAFLNRYVWRFGDKKRIVLYITLFIFANIVNFFQPLIIGYVLNIIQEQGVTSTSLPSITLALSLLVVSVFAFWIFHGPARIIEKQNAFIARANYKKFLLEGVMQMPTEWHTNNHSGDTIDRINKATDALYMYSGITYEIIETIIRFVGSYAALVYFDIHASYLVLFLCIIIITIIIQFDKKLIPQYKTLNRSENIISAKVYDAISNITTIIIMRLEKLMSNNIFKKILDPFDLHLRSNKMNETKWFLVNVCSVTMMFAMLLSYILAGYYSGTVILVGTVFILYGYLDRINGLFFRFAYRYGDIVRLKTNVMNAEEIASEFSTQKIIEGKMTKDWKSIEVKSLNFAYQTNKGKNLHLNNVSFTIHHGERIAFIGASGSGKTTMLKVMIDLYTPKDSEISLDGQKLMYGFGDVRDNMALIPQDPELFNTTILENITMGNEYSMDDVANVVEMASFAGVVERLPNKYDSSIKERGVNLSGGEKQRLALARGLLACKDKHIVLLDEPTSSVDSKNELTIYQNIFKQYKDKTIISSIHRLHLLPLFDNIYYFENGKIVASGTFKTMMKYSKFKKMWKKYTASQKTKKNT
ncbi:MAG: ABC transporter ATP-binding protein [Candidatus Woesearchaeota archaeon]